MKLKHIAARILGRPMLMEPKYAQHFFAAFGTRAGVNSIEGFDVSLMGSEQLQKYAESYQVRQARFGNGSYEPYAIMGDGIAVVQVEGSLAHKTGNLDPESGMTGYDGIRAKLEMAMKDPAVKGILMDVDSPGGEVSGAFDLADFIAGSKQKQIWAYANDLMASAAYLVGSQADKVFASQTASVGSIGVLVAHADYSKAMEAEGVKVTLIHSGEHKVDGNPYAALPDGVKSDIQAEIDGLRDKFAASVSRGRKMSKESILDTEARVYPGAKAVEMGLVDGVASFDEVIATFSNEFTRSGEVKPKGTTMTYEVVASAPGLSEADVEKLMMDARAEGVKAGAVAERARIQGILAHAESDGRTATAQHLAFATDMTPEAAVSLLGTMPKAAVVGIPAGLMEGAGVKAEAESVQMSESEKASAATKAAIAALLKK
jgi:signal peptide peptidase SppA